MGRIIAILILYVASLLNHSFAAARAQDADIKGKVVNSENQPVASASVYLMSSTGNVLIKSAVTDENGTYTILKAPKGNYYIEVTSVGYGKARSAAFDLDDKLVTVEDIKLLPASQTIETVTVQGQMPTVKNVNGKLVLNVENSTLAAGNNALEVVKRAPGVSVDKDDNLQLMGQQGVNVTIDGRLTYMSGEQLATFLKSTDAAQIKSVEVTTTRQAKDDAEGAIGTINIVLKKNNTEGFNGSFVASAGHGKYFRGNSSLALNYKKKNTTLFGSYAYTNNKEINELDIIRDIAGKERTTYFNQEADMIEKNQSHTFRVGVEQKTSNSNTLMFQVSGNNYLEDANNNSITNIGFTPTTIDTVLRSPSIVDMSFGRISFNLNNEYKIDTLGSKLTLDLDYSLFKNRSDMDYVYRTEHPNTGALFYPEEREHSNMPTDIDIYVGKLDYIKPLKKGSLEAGLKYSNVKSDNNMMFERLVGSTWENVEDRTNHFIYTEQISAGYVDYSRPLGKKWSAKVGVRAEYTISDGNLVTNNSTVKRDYLDFFPSANIGYNINENHILSLSYAKKVSRPNYRSLNPFRYYIDKLTYQLGNPYVNPQYTHGFSLNYTLMKMFNFTLGTDITNDAIVESMGQDSIRTWVTKENLGKSVTSYLNMNIPYRVGKFWTMNNNITALYMHFKGPIAGYEIDKGSFFIQGNSYHNFRLGQQWSAEATINGNTPFVYNLFKIHARIGVDIGANYNFKDQKSSLKLAVTDVFRSNRNNLTTNFNEFQSKIRQYNDRQTVRLTYTYKFGNLKQQIRKSDSRNEEKDRVSQ